MTPEEQKFLDAGNSTKTKSKPKPKTKSKSTPRKEEPPMARPALKQELPPQQPIAKPTAQTMPQFSMPGAVSLNVRIEPEISTALLRASMDRKIQRLDPFTQRDIVADALA